MAYKEAGPMFEKAERPNECCRCLDEAKGLYAQEGRLSECAKLAKRRAEIFEKAEIIDLMLESYAEAAELFDGEDQKGETRNCKLKIAHYKALIEERTQSTRRLRFTRRSPRSRSRATFSNG